MSQVATELIMSRRDVRQAPLQSMFDAALSPSWMALAGTGVVIGLAESVEWRDWSAEAWDLLDDAELARVQRRRLFADRELALAAYALRRLMLGRLLGCDPGKVPLVSDALGCPRIPGTRVATSLSHSDGCIALAITAVGAVGVDIEPASRAPVMAEVADQVCHPSEGAALAGYLGAQWNEALLRLWVRKEAFLKADGVGMARDMRSFAAPDNAVLPLSGDAGGDICVRSLDLGPQWVGAVAAPPSAPIVWAWLRPGGTPRTDALH